MGVGGESRVQPSAGDWGTCDSADYGGVVEKEEIRGEGNLYFIAVAERGVVADGKGVEGVGVAGDG